MYHNLFLDRSFYTHACTLEFSLPFLVVLHTVVTDVIFRGKCFNLQSFVRFKIKIYDFFVGKNIEGRSQDKTY